MTTIVRVNGDGSGTVDHTMLVSKAALAQIRQFSQFAGGRGGAPIDLISEDQARMMAGSLGPGVTYVSSTPIDTPLGEGRQATFAFTDITQVRINPQPKTDGLPIKTPQALSDNGEITCTFTRDPNGNSILRIHLPEPDFQAALGNVNTGTPALAQQLAMVRAMLAGARVLIAVEPAGQLVKASSPFVDGQRVTLLDVNLDQLLGSETLIAQLQAAKTADDVKAALKDAPGLKIALDREVTIEFTPAR